MIRKLSDRIIRQIAAGEVISRPYNAVKELIENSIDAKATSIQIFFKEYGMESIIIIDNGTGITKEDLKLATQLHTTSKTEESDSVFGINSFGFRGEALASIEAISSLIIESNGYKLENQTLSESVIQKGTRISVQNLFKNIPARLKFIKNSQTEFRYVKELLKKFMIQHNEISWLISLNGKIIWNLKKDLKTNRIQMLLKEENILTKTVSTQHTTIDAFILKQQINNSIIFVNKRCVRDKAIFKYISSLFKEYTFLNENPGYILDISIDPLLVDYNVHPAKEEIRFLNYNTIFSLLHSIFSMNELAQHLNPAKAFFSDHSINEEIEKKSLYENLRPSFLINSISAHNKNFVEESSETFINPSVSQVRLLESNSKNINQHVENPLFKLIGQLKNSYILFENENGFGIFDQHAAHERKLYEQLKSGLNRHNSQKLISTIELSLSEKIQMFIEEQTDTLADKGIFIKGTEIMSLPSMFSNISELIHLLQNLRVPCDLPTEIDRLLANVACKNALKANTTLSHQQMHSLLESALINPPICNHGRPVFKYFSDNEIKNFFKRT